jgi:hypothetical protein
MVTVYCDKTRVISDTREIISVKVFLHLIVQNLIRKDVCLSFGPHISPPEAFNGFLMYLVRRSIGPTKGSKMNFPKCISYLYNICKI